MAIDDDRLARMLARDRDAILRQCALPGADQALFRARVGASRCRAARVSGLVDRLMLGALGLLAVAAAVSTLVYVPLSDRVFGVVIGALGLGGGGLLAALVVTRTAAFTDSVNKRGWSRA